MVGKYKVITLCGSTRFKDGFMEIPEAPGIGVELSENAEELYPAKSRGSNDAFRYFDGSVKDW